MREVTKMATQTRRKILQGGAALAVAATGVAAIAVKGAFAASDVTDEAMRDLWRRFIDAELRFSDACSAEDEASFAVRTECAATLVCPWTPLSRKGDWQTSVTDRSECQLRVEQVLAPTVMQQGGVGPWLVKEFQPASAQHPYACYSGDLPVRWQPYPEATTVDDAYGVAKARADKEWRSYRAKSGAISRKHKHRALKAAVETASDVCGDVRQEIAEAPASGPLATAVKLALWAYGSDIDPRRTAGTILEIGGEYDVLEHAALWSVHTAAVTACGYDPLTAIYEAIDLARNSRDDGLAMESNGDAPGVGLRPNESP